MKREVITTEIYKREPNSNKDKLLWTEKEIVTREMYDEDEPLTDKELDAIHNYIPTPSAEEEREEKFKWIGMVDSLEKQLEQKEKYCEYVTNKLQNLEHYRHYVENLAQDYDPMSFDAFMGVKPVEKPSDEERAYNKASKDLTDAKLKTEYVRPDRPWHPNDIRGR